MISSVKRSRKYFYGRDKVKPVKTTFFLLTYFAGVKCDADFEICTKNTKICINNDLFFAKIV